jgi:lipopolysaccharide heptosyltransferase I
MPARVLIVRLGAMGDLVHALPVLAALREAWRDATIDWLVDARYASLLRFVSGIDHTFVVGGRAGHMRRGTDGDGGAGTRLEFRGVGGVWAAVRFLRRQRYDAALDLQGLIKSAALARASGARRVIGFAAGHLREPAARVFYGEAVEPAAGVHVVWKNMAMVRALGVGPAGLVFPLGASLDAGIAEALPLPDASGGGTFAVVNPGAGWPNKRWAPDRFGAVAAHLASRHGLRSLVTWGPGEQALAEAVVRASGGAARCAPSTGLGDLIAVLGRARIFVGGDTGPLQLAAALGTPTVAVFGPTSPARNGSWSAEDISLSRFDTCECHHKRRCRRTTPCIDDIEVSEVIGAVDRRLGA